jgi:hypothetical protein
MNGERTARQTVRIVLVIDSRESWRNIANAHKGNVPFIVFNPYNKSKADYLNLLVRNLELQTEIEETDQTDKVEVVFR